MSKILLFLLLALGGCVGTDRPPETTSTAEAREPVTLLVSIDGLRPDYLGRGHTPNLDALATAGVAASMKPSFPTLTFPNHYSIVTGLRPDRHGIVDNAMEDARRPDVKFTLGNATQSLDPFWWDQAEPIWATAEKQGVRTATMFWPGSEVAIRGTRPADWLRYDKNVSNRQRIATVVDWLRRPAATRPRLVTLYFDTVDTAGHEHGPDAEQTMAAIAEVDARIGELRAEATQFGQPLNFVITSDHGMIATSPERVVRIHTLLDPGAYRTVSELPFITIQPQPGREADVARALLRPHEHMECWRKDEIPARFEYGRNPRVPVFLCLGEPGWMLLGAEPTRTLPKGMHGYDNSHPAMAATFIASGPAFRAGTTLPSLDNIDVYPLLARLVGVAPLASDADGDALAALR